MVVLQLFANNQGEWIKFNESGVIISCQPIIDLMHCPKMNAQDQLTILFPGEQLLLSKVKLPKMGWTEKLKAIPYALEDRLAGDPDDMAVAIGETKSDGESIVAVFEKNVMDEKIKSWHVAALFPRCVIPDFLAIAWKPETWSMVIKNKMALVRTDFDEGFAVDADNAILSLQLALQKNKDHLPKRILCWQSEKIISPVELEKLAIPIEWLDETIRSVFDWIGLTTRPPINLLQGKYQATLPFSQLKKNWLRCGIAASVFVFFLFATQLTQWIYFSHQSQQLENHIVSVYSTLFSGETDVLEPHFRTEALLKKYERASEGGVFLKLMGVMGSAMTPFSAITVQSISYDNKTLQVNVLSDNMNAVNGVLQKLRLQPVLVSQHITTTSHHVIANIAVQEKS